MKAIDFEYAVRKDVRNNPIVREVDAERQRELWRSVGVGVLLGGLLLFSAWQHFELLRHGYRIERMQQERAAEEEIRRHLTVEIETLQDPKRIESLAIKKLRMVPPVEGEAVVIERVPAPDPPDKSIVASR